MRSLSRVMSHHCGSFYLHRATSIVSMERLSSTRDQTGVKATGVVSVSHATTYVLFMTCVGSVVFCLKPEREERHYVFQALSAAVRKGAAR